MTLLGIPTDYKTVIAYVKRAGLDTKLFCRYLHFETGMGDKVHAPGDIAYLVAELEVVSSRMRKWQGGSNE